MTAHITQLLLRAAQQNPNGHAVDCNHGPRTWRETYQRVQRTAGGLAQAGVEAGSQVAILALNSDIYFESLFAIPAMGARIVPVNTRWAVPEIEYALTDSESSAILFDRAFLKAVSEIRASNSTLRHYFFIGDEADRPDWAQPLEDLQKSDPLASLVETGGGLAGIFYTGGTTGFPKGVMLSHSALISSAMAVVEAVAAGPKSVVLHAAPMFHLADLSSCFAYTMLAAKHVFVPVFEPGYVLKTMDEYSVSDLLLVPTMIKLLVESAAFSPSSFSEVQNLLYGASPMPESLLEHLLSQFPHLKFLQAFGQTEMAPVISLLRSEDHSLAPSKRTLLRSAGRSIATVAVAVKGDDGKEVSIGEVGEVCAMGPSVMLGYWNKPEETEKVLVDGWLHTGDAGFVDDNGYLYIVDRVKDMIITGGENVYSAEVENTIAGLSGVLQVAVIGIPSQQWGESVHAVVYAAPGTEMTEEQVIEHCKRHIAAYKCPKSVAITGAPLPMSGAGKILKRELREQYLGAVENGQLSQA